MKYFQQSVDFDYSWEEVSTSNWQKYGPWNEKTPHVIAVDTLSRSVDASTGIVSDSLHHMPSPRSTPDDSTRHTIDTDNALT
jgi:PRELI-like family